MSSKRNKLLIFLGLVTVAVSKAHNQRFNSEYGFESKRISASKHSANPSLIDSRSTDGLTSSGLPVTIYHQDHPPEFSFDDHSNQEPDKITRRSLNTYYDLGTPDIVPNHGQQEQFSKRVGSLQQDSSDLSVDIDPQDFYFEAKKVKTNERNQKSRGNRDMPQESFFTRRTGMLNADEEKTNSKSNKKKNPTETKAKDAEPKVTAKAIIVNDKKSKIDSQEPRDDKATIKKKKPRIKKVLRVRVRGQKGNKTQKIDAKHDSKLTPNEKTKDDILLQNPRSRSSKHIKFPEVKGSAIKDSLKETSTKPTFPESDTTSNIPKAKYSKEAKISHVKKESVKDPGRTTTIPKSDTALNEQKPKYSKEVTFAEVKIPTVIKDAVKVIESSPMPPQTPQVLEVYHTDKNSASSSKKKTAETGVTKNKDSKENDQVVKFFRRSGKKIAGKTEPQPDYPNADWVSKYRAENLNKDDNFYVLSFNYMGNKNDPVKDILYIPKVPAPQEKLRDAQEVLHVKPPREIGEYPSPELNIHNLEQNAENFLGKQRKPVKSNLDDSSTYSNSDERDVVPLNENNRGNRYYKKKVESSEDFSMNDRRITEKLLPPKVTLKKKKTKKQNNPVWKLQAQKKNFPGDQWSQSKASSQEAQDNFRTGDEEHSEKFNTNGENYFVRSFIKLPTGDNVDINLKKDDMTQNFQQEQFKVVNTQRKPLFPAENGGGGNYFVHMYKKVGDIENFDFKSGDAAENKGYMSSLKLSWTDDDTRAQVDEAVDSLAVLPNVEHSYSNEHSISSREDSSGDEYTQQPSENIMDYKHHDIDDFMSPLNEDKSYFYPDVPITHRLKRSTDIAPRVTTHFKIGKSKVESNYTLDQNPVGTFSTQSGPSLNIRREAVMQQISQAQTPRMSELSDTPVNRQKDTNVKSYYLKSNENKELNPLKMEFKSSDIFNKYENPSRGVTNVQIFQSYQSPNRDPKQAHDVTYFHNDKNRKIKIHITDRVAPLETQISRSNETYARNTALNNFKLASSGVIQSSTDIKASYLKPENEEGRSNLLNKTNANAKVFHVNNTHMQSESLQNPVFQQRMDETTGTPTTIALTTNSKRTTEPMKTSSDKRRAVRTDYLRTKPTSTTYFNKITKSATTIVPNRPATMHIATAVTDRPTIKPTEATVPNRPTVKSTATTVPIRPTVKSTATTVPIRPTVKSTATTVPVGPEVKSTATTVRIKSGVKSTATTLPISSAVKSTATTVPIRSSVKSTATTVPIRSSVKSTTTTVPIRSSVKSTTTVPMKSTVKSTATTVPIRSSVKYTATTLPIRSTVKSTATTIPIRQATKFTPTTQPNRITTKSLATATSERTTKFTTPDVTPEKTTKLTTPALTSDKTSRPTTTVAQFFHKTGDINTKIDSSPSNIQPRRIDDKTWLYPQRELRNGKHELQAESRQHLESNSAGKSRANGPEVLARSTKFEHSSNGIDPKVSFEWQDPLHLVSEQNYPKYHSIPKTRFTCKKRAPGYYADPETACQVFHMCQGTGVKHSFLCPNTTIFNQRLLVCDWYSKVTCDSSESFYTGNSDIYRYQSERENNFNPETNKDWNSPPNQNTVTTKYPQPKQESYVQNKNQVTYTNSYKDTQVTDMPQFVVNHFKENIPRAEFGKPKSVTKSYSTVIAMPKSKIIPTVSAAKHNHHSKEKPNPIFHQKLTNTNEKLIPDTLLEKQRAIYNRWNTKEAERTLNHELNAPEPHKVHHGKHLPYSTPNQDTLNHEDNNYHFPEKSRVNNGNSYYVPNIGDANRYENEEDDEIHFAGRQNDKVIVVNRNRLYPEYEPTEGPGLQEPEKRLPGESLTKFTHSVPTKVTTKTPYKDFPGTKILNHGITPQTPSNFQSQSAYKINNGGNSNQASQHNMYNSKEARNQKQSYNGPRTPQYIYPLPGIVQNNDGSREFNYGYRVEDPKSINLPNPEILSITSFRSNNNILRNPERETSKSNKNILIKPENIAPIFNKNILTTPQSQNPRFNKNIHVGLNSETPMFNKNIHIGPNNETPRFNHVGSNSETSMFNKNIHTEPNRENPRFSKNILVGTNSETLMFAKNSHIGPNNETPRFNKNINVGPNNETPRFNKNIHEDPNSETPRFNKDIHEDPNSETPRFSKNIRIKPNNETPRFNKHIHLEHINETPRFNKNILIETGNENPVFNKNVVIKPDPRFKDDSQAGKIKWRIAEIKSGIESIGAQVGKILDDNAFKNVRIFKLKPESSSGELEEIKLTPFKSERQPRIPQNSKTKEEKKAKLSLSSIKMDPNNRENSNPAFKPNIRVQPINGGKRYEGRSNFRLYATENAGANYNTPLTMLPAQKLAEQVVRDIVPKQKEVSKLQPKTANHGTGTPRSYDQIVKVMPHNVRTKNRSTKREMVPVGTHESVNINQYKQLPETSGRADYDTEIKIPSKLGMKETLEKKYEVKYIPLIKIEKITEPKVENKKLIHEEEIRKPVPLYINQKSEHFDHVIVPKKIQGRYQPEFHYPKKIKVQENSDSSEIRSTDLPDWKPTSIGMNEKYKFDNIDKSEFRKSGDLPINNPQTKSLNTDRQVYDTTRPETQKKEVRTFVVVTKPVPAAEKHSNFKSSKAHYDNHKTILTPIQTKLQNLNSNVDPSLDCDDSSTSSQNPFNTLTLQLGKNGPSQEFIKYIPLTKPSNNERETDNVRIYYNSGDESSSKCRNKDSSKSKNQDISIPESDEKNLDKKLFFNKKPFSKVTFKELKRPTFTFSPNKTPVRFNTKTLEENEQKRVSPKMKPIKLFELQRNSRPAFTKPSSQKPTTPTNPESKVYFFPATKTEEEKALDESEDDSDRKSVERSKRVASGKKTKYADLEKAAELKTGIHNHKNEKKVEAVHFSAARKGPQNKTVGKSEDSNESSSSHSRQSRYAEMEKAAELKAERMLRSKSRST